MSAHSVDRSDAETRAFEANDLRARRDGFARALVRLHAQRRGRSPALSIVGSDARPGVVEEVHGLLEHLTCALGLNDPRIFTDHVEWVRARHASSEGSEEELGELLSCLHEILSECSRAKGCAPLYVWGGREMLSSPARRSELRAEPTAVSYLEALMDADQRQASLVVFRALNEGMSIESIYVDVFQWALDEVGRRWQSNQLSVADEHFCTASTQLIMAQLSTQLLSAPKAPPRLVAACAAGDQHEVGLRMITNLFQLAGHEALFLGANTPPESLPDVLFHREAAVLALSASLPIHLPAAARAIAMVRGDPRCASVRILVGGRPFSRSPELYKRVGADGTAADAHGALFAIHRLVTREPG